MLGSQQPTSYTVPEYEFSRGDDAIEIAAIAGLNLDPYQCHVLTEGLGVVRRASTLEGDSGDEREYWSAREVGIELSRQNGKSAIFEARALAGLFVFREKLIVYSAHKGETAMGAFSRIEALIRSDPELLAEVNGFRRTNGKEAIELVTGQTIKFRTRTAGGGRGLSGDCVILDEAQDLTDEHLAALLPVVSAMPNAQLWYGGSAGNKKSVVQGRLVRRCERKAPFLAYFRWAAPEDCDRTDEAIWARVNPAVGRRMTLESIRAEYDAMSPQKFDEERLGIGDYPRAEGEDWVIPRRRWDAGMDRQSKIVTPVVFSVEVQWHRLSASISVAGRRADGRKHIETIANEAGTSWTVPELARLVRSHDTLGTGVVLDPASPANNLVGPLRDAGIEVHLLTSSDLTRAFGDLYDGFMGNVDQPPAFRHGGGSVLTSALAEAQIKTAGGASTWKRATTADVTSLLSCTWAAHGVTIFEDDPVPDTSPVTAAEAVGAAGIARSDLATMSF